MIGGESRGAFGEPRLLYMIEVPDSVLHIFNRDIPVYGICFFAGIFIAYLMGIPLFKKRNLEPFDLTCSGVFTMIGAALGAKVLFIIISWKEIVALKLSLLEIISGGFVFYGGLVGGVLGLVLYLKIYRLPFQQILDIYAVILPLGHAIGRFGCFCSGCCYGIPYDGVFNCVYTNPLSTDTPVGVGLFPVQLLEYLMLLVLFVVQLLIYVIWNGKPKLSLKIYLISYSLLRFFLEFLRGDLIRGSFLSVTTSQWISLVILLAVSLYILVDRKSISDHLS